MGVNRSTVVHFNWVCRGEYGIWSAVIGVVEAVIAVLSYWLCCKGALLAKR